MQVSTHASGIQMTSAGSGLPVTFVPMPLIQVGTATLTISIARDFPSTHNFRLGGGLSLRLISNNSGSASYHTGHLQHSDSSHYDSGSHYFPASPDGNHDEHDEANELECSPVRHTATGSPSAIGSQSITIATPSPPTTSNVGSGSNATPTSTSAPQLLPSTHRSRFPTGAIVGIIIGVCLILLAILCVWLRRRRPQPAYPTAFPITSTDTGTSDPSNVSVLDDADLHRTSAAGRHHMRTESRGGQEKTFSEESRSLTSSSPPTYPPGRNVQLSTAFRTFGSDSPGSPGPEVVWQLQEMTARVRELEAQLESPPPGYSGEEPARDYCLEILSPRLGSMQVPDSIFIFDCTTQDHHEHEVSPESRDPCCELDLRANRILPEIKSDESLVKDLAAAP
ncbi:hypothetical protein B0H13DRAFT_1860935 [Mycena leptocephala]|nr:hypothetical protein B0H13DRAFT_1860935 [Mycena leptocephala]